MAKPIIDSLALLSFADKIGTDGCRKVLSDTAELNGKITARAKNAEAKERAILDPVNFGPDAEPVTTTNKGPTNQDPAGNATGKAGPTCPICGKGKRRGSVLCAACAKASKVA